MVRQTASIVVFEILGGVVLVTALLVGVLAFRLASGPLELGIFRDDVERALTRARDGRPVLIDTVFLEWSPEDRRVIVTANDLRMLDSKGETSAEAERAEIVLAASSLFFGEVDVLALDLESGWVDIVQISNSEWAIAGDPLPPIPTGELPQSSREWLERANEVLPVVLTAMEDTGERLSFENLNFKDFDLKLRGQDGASLLTVSDTTGKLGRTEDGFEFSVGGSGLGQGLPKGMAIDLKTSGTGERMAIELALAEWPLAALAERLGTNPAGVSGLMSDINIALELSRETGVEQVVIRADAGEGKAPFGSSSLEISDLELIATYAALADTLALDIRSSSAGPLSGGVVATIEDALLVTEDLRSFDLQSPRLRMDLRPRFAGPVTFSNVNLSGTINAEAGELTLDSVVVGVGDATLNATVDVKRTGDTGKGTVPFTGKITLESEGTLTKSDILSLWPVTLGGGARRFLLEKVEAENVTDIVAALDLKRDSFEDNYLKDEALDLTFNLVDGEVSVLHDLPPITGASGRGHLKGNGFSIAVDSAEFAGWQLSEGLFDQPAFNPRGEPFRVFVKGSGKATDLMKVLVDTRLNIDFDPERVSGDGELTFELLRPGLDNVPYEDLRFTANGVITDAGLSDAALGLGLTGGTANVNVTPAGVTISGSGDLGASPVQFTWRDGFSDGDMPSDLSATAVITPDVLNSLGLMGRAYLSGEIPVEVQAKIKGEGIDTALVAMDLDRARVDLSEVGYIKPKGVPAKASVQIAEDGNQRVTTIYYDSKDALIDADMTLGADSQLLSATLRKAFLRDTADVTGTIRREANGAINLELGGAFLDISGAVPDISAVGGAADSNITPMILNAEVGTLRLRDELDLSDAKITLISTQAGIQRFEAAGTTDDGSAIEGIYDASGDDAPTLSVSSGNAGFLAATFMGIDFLEGGDLTLSSTLAKDGTPTKMNVNIRDTQMINAPFLTQILSLASLQGLADTLGGEGVRFSSIDIPITISEGRYIIDGAKAQGPALGLTTSGFYSRANGAIEFDGVLVPSFGLNSALGGIPIIGDLVVGRDGEGVFSLIYTVDGTLDKANVGVNPLSALAPGVIRRIFENPSDTRIPEAKPRAPDEPIPSELAPIPEEEF